MMLTERSVELHKFEMNIRNSKRKHLDTTIKLL